MARRKTHPDFVRLKSSLSDRLKQVRTQLFGDRGGPEMARRLGLPIRTWYNYESGVTVPAEVVLKFVELTSVDPIWLLRGEGEPFRLSSSSTPPMAMGGRRTSVDPDPTSAVRDLLRAALNRLESRTVVHPPSPRPQDATTSTVDSGSLPSASAAAENVLLTVENHHPAAERGDVRPRMVVAHRDWVGRNEEFRCLMVEGSAMAPIVADGAFVAYSDRAEPLQSLDDQMVVARVEGRMIVRWLQLSGRYAILRAENPETERPTILVELTLGVEDPSIRRVLWINTPH